MAPALRAGKHRLRTLDALAQALLEFRVLFPRLNVLGNGRSDHLDDWNRVDVSNCLKLLGLLRRKADCHGLAWFHAPIVSPRLGGCQVPSHRDTMVTEPLLGGAHHDRRDQL